jgi:hypothetical protein
MGKMIAVLLVLAMPISAYADVVVVNTDETKESDVYQSGVIL